jgi:glycerol uptake facilitator-like aquaporin
VIDTRRVTYIGAFAFEAGTFFLVNTVSAHTAVRRNASQLAPVAIGMTVTICILGFGVLTGGQRQPGPHDRPGGCGRSL